MACAGCSASRHADAPDLRRLPPKPAFLQPVYVKMPQASEDAELRAAIERAGRARANDIIICGADWIDRKNAAYAAGKVESDPSAIVTCRHLEQPESRQ